MIDTERYCDLDGVCDYQSLHVIGRFGGVGVGGGASFVRTKVGV